MSVRVNREANELVVEGTLRTSGGSTVTTLPPDLLEQAGLEAGDEVEFAVSFEGEEIKIRGEVEDA